MDRKPQICFRCDEPFRDKFIGAARHRGTKAQAVLESFARAWLDDPDGRWLTMLTTVLASGDDTAIKNVQSSIEHNYNMVRASARARSSPVKLAKKE